MFSDQLLVKMTRSNKKKTFLKPFQKQPSGQSFLPPNKEIVDLMTNERNLMISRAITSARNHGINLRHGSPNPGTGDCAFVSVIQSNNERQCFTEKFLISTNLGYRYGKPYC